jgi:hypothetical protein
MITAAWLNSGACSARQAEGGCPHINLRPTVAHATLKASGLHALSRHDDGGAINRVLFHRQQRFVGLIEGEYSNLRLEADLGGEVQKVTGVAASHIGDAAKLAFAPQQAVVVELRHAIEMDGIDGYHSSFAQACQGGNDDISRRGKCDGTIKFNGRLFGLGSNPGGAKGFGELAMGFSASRDVNFAFPSLQYGDHEVSGGAETKESDAFASLDSCDAQAAEADDAGTEQRSSVEIVEGAGQGENKIGAG